MIPLTWHLPEGVRPASAASKLAASLGATAGEPTRLARTVLDTFDGRLHGAGLRLVVDAGATETVARLRDGLDDVLASGPVEGLPRRGEDLPVGRLRDSVAPIVAPRALLPRAEARVEARPLAVRDGLGKVVVGVVVEDVVAVGADREVRLGTLARLQSVRGHPDALALARDALVGLGASAVGDGAAGLLLAALRVPFGPLAPTLDVVLDPAERADRAAKQVLRVLLDVWKAQEPGVRDDLDSEFLHDARVALRRTRSILSELRTALPEAHVARHREGFRWLQGVSSELRDLDVWLERLPVLALDLPPRVREHLGPLRDQVAHDRVRARDHLLRALDSPRYARLMDTWAAWLEGGVPKRPSAPDAQVPIVELVRRRLVRVARRLRDDGRAIGPTSPAVDLHALRKVAKRLRYLLDLFRSVLPDEPLALVLTELKRLQANLGDVQDLEVQAHTVAVHAAVMIREGGVSADTVLAMGVLAEDLRARQAEARAAFEAVFADWDRKRVRRALEALEGRR